MNVTRPEGLSRVRALLGVRRRRYEAVVLLHSVFSNGRLLYGELYRAIARSSSVKAYFIGNEYKLMPEKMDFCEELGVHLLVSMTSNPRVHDLYRARIGCQVVAIPSAGIDPAVFFPAVPLSARTIDLGYRAYAEPLYLGYQERTALAEHFSEGARRQGLVVDVSLDPAARFERAEYAAFLNRCVGQLGSEAGTDYFDLEDSTRKRVNEYLARRPSAGLDELYAQILDRVERLPARMISGRQSEAAATKTVQLLFEGEYSGVFRADVHYIALKKDFSNVEEALDRFRDDATRRDVTESAYLVALEELSYGRLIDRFHAALEPLLR